MTEEEYWLKTEHVEVMLRVLRGRESDRKLRLFICHCCRDVESLLNEEQKQAISLAERYVDGFADDVEREAALCSLVEGVGGSAELARCERPHGYVLSYCIPSLLPVCALLINGEYVINGHDGRPLIGLKNPQEHTCERASAVAEWAAMLLAYERREAERGVFGRFHEMMFRCVTRLVDGYWPVGLAIKERHYERPRQVQRARLRDIFGNPFRPVVVDPSWLTSDVLSLARGIDEDRAFDRMPILADALQDAGCDSADVLDHCRDASITHVRGCWVVDLLLGKS